MKFSFTVFVFCVSVRVFAQDPFFSQPNYGWSLINPAYVGSLACARAEAGYRLQWPALSASYQTYYASYDQYFKFGGLGVSYLHDNAGGWLNTNRYDVNYSYGFNIGMKDDYKPKVVIQPGVQFSLQSKTINWDKLVFGSMIDPQQGVIYNSNQDIPYGKWTHSYFDFSAGLLVYSKRISAGLALFHITRPNEGVLGYSPLRMREVYHISGILGNADVDGNGLSLIPSVLYMRHRDIEQSVLTLTAKFNGISIGCGYRMRDAILFTGSYTWHDMSLAYSYDLTTSDLSNTGGSHEIHFAYRFLKDQWSAERRNLQMFF